MAILEKQLLERCRTVGPRPARGTVDEIPIHACFVARRIVA
jgi:hypothetical protein